MEESEGVVMDWVLRFFLFVFIFVCGVWFGQLLEALT